MGGGGVGNRRANNGTRGGVTCSKWVVPPQGGLPGSRVVSGLGVHLIWGTCSSSHGVTWPRRPCKHFYATLGNIKYSSAAIRIGEDRIGEVKNIYHSCLCPVRKQHQTA